MQTGGAYVDQIPAGVRPPTATPPAIKITRNTAPVPQRPAPPGLYVQVANVTTQEQGIRAGLELSQRLGRDRPPFIRGEAAPVDGQMRLRLYAGPFVDEGGARRFCAAALPGQSCSVRMFQPAAATAPSPKTNGPANAGPRAKGD